MIEGKGIRFARFSVEQGLSQSRVDHMLQDDQGFMWFGTYNGLNRYDGYHFKVYKPEENNPNSLGGVFVTPMFKDRSGVLWIGIDQGLDRFDPVTQTFTHFRSNPKDPDSLAGFLEHITQDRDGMLWLATRNGLDRLDPATGQFTHYRNDPKNPHSLSSNDVRYVLEDKQGTLWVATSTALNAFNRRSGIFTRYPNFRDAALDRIFEDRSGQLWVSSTRAGGLASLDRKTGRFTLYTWFDEGPSSPSVRGCSAILEDQYGMLWLATDPDGVVKFDRKGRKFTRFRNDPSNPASLSSNVCLSLSEDREGNIWVGTGVGGVNRFSSTPPPFTVYEKEPGNPKSLDQSFVLSVFEDSQGILWIGTWGGSLNRLDRKTGRYTFYRHNPADPGSISNGTVFAAAEDRMGFLWFGTWGGGLCRFDRKTGQFKAYRHNPADPHSLSQDTVLALCIDHSGNLWAGTENGLNRFDPRTEHFTVYRDLKDPPPSRIYRSLIEGPDGSMWLGTYEWGVERLDVRTGKLVTYMNDPKVEGSLSNNRVNAFCVDNRGRLWLGTQNGLDRYDPKTDRFVPFYEHDGLPNNAIQGILEDAKGILWVSTGNGLSKFDPQANTFKNYYVDDGLAGNEFNNYGVYFTAKGEMFFGGPSGITAFYPDRVVENPYVPPIVLTDFRLFNNPVTVGENSVLRKSISFTDTLTLSHEQNIFSLEFASLSFANPQRNRYRYRLEGLETTWNEVSSNHRFVTYTTLPPGRYTFRVQGSSGSGVWNVKGVSVVVTILPPWWQELWFRVIATVLALAIIWTAYSLRVRSIQRHNRELTVLNLELQRSRSDLQESQGMLAEAQHIAHVGHWSYDIDAGSFDWSDEAHHILGLPTNALDLDRSQFSKLVHPDDRQSIDKLFECALTSGQPFEVEHRIICPNGEMREVHVRGNPIADDNHRVQRIFGTIQDITDRRHAEEALRRLNRELRAISNCNQLLVRATDEQELLNEICRIVCEEAGYGMAFVGYAENGETANVRPAAWAGAESGRLAISDLSWADTAQVSSPTRTSIRTGDIVIIQDFTEAPPLSPLGEKALRQGYRSCIALPLKDEAGAAFGAFKIFSVEPNAFTAEEIRMLSELAGDLAFGITVLRARTERNQAYEEIRLLNAELEARVRQRTEQLETTNKDLESFSYSVSHDLQAPLRNISGFAQILIEDEGERLTEDGRHLLMRIDRNTKRMANIVNGLLNLSRLGRQEIHFRPVALEDIVRDVVAELAPDCPNRQVEWKIGPLPTVEGEPDLIRQVFQNLVANALKFSRVRSQAIIEIGEMPQVGAHLLFVRDNGVGFDMKYSEKLFDVFQRLHSAEEFEGTGIGLATVKRIIEKHGGRVWAESEPDKGATFYFTLGKSVSMSSHVEPTAGVPTNRTAV